MAFYLMSVPSSAISASWRGTFLVAFSGMLYGAIGYCGTQLFHQHFSVPTMLFWRFFVAMVGMLCFILVSKKNVFQLHGTPTAFIKMLFLGVISYSGASAFYFVASKYIGTGLAMVIFFSFPVFVTLFAWFLSTWRMNKYAFFSLLAVVIGLLCLKGNGPHALNMFGIMIAVTAALCYAIYVYGSRHSASLMDSRLQTFLICAGNTLVFFIISSYDHSLFIPTTLSAWLYILSLGLLATALPIQLLLDGLKYISPIKASILSVLEPVVTVLFGLTLLHETISYVQLLGIMIVLLGAILIQFERTPAHAH